MAVEECAASSHKQKSDPHGRSTDHPVYSSFSSRSPPLPSSAWCAQTSRHTERRVREEGKSVLPQCCLRGAGLLCVFFSTVSLLVNPKRKSRTAFDHGPMAYPFSLSLPLSLSLSPSLCPHLPLSLPCPPLIPCSDPTTRLFFSSSPPLSLLSFSQSSLT